MTQLLGCFLFAVCFTQIYAKENINETKKTVEVPTTYKEWADEFPDDFNEVFFEFKDDRIDTELPKPNSETNWKKKHDHQVLTELSTMLDDTEIIIEFKEAKEAKEAKEIKNQINKDKNSFIAYLLSCLGVGITVTTVISAGIYIIQKSQEYCAKRKANKRQTQNKNFQQITVVEIQ